MIMRYVGLHGAPQTDRPTTEYYNEICTWVRDKGTGPVIVAYMGG